MSKSANSIWRKTWQLLPGLLFAVQAAFGQTSFQWLLDSAHPRDLALANALVAAPNAAQALGVNPAGISLAAEDNNPGFALSLRKDPAAIYQVSTQAIFPLGGYTAAVQLRNVRFGKLAGYDADGISTGDYSANDILLTGGLSHQFGRYLKFGVALGGVQGKIAEFQALGLYWSAGMQLNIERFDLRLGLVTSYNGAIVQQFTDKSADELPTVQLVGLEKSLAHLPLTLYVAGGKSSASQDPILRLGGEFRLGSKVRFRLGVDQGKLDFATDDEYKNLLAGISLGLGYFSHAVQTPGQSTYNIQWGLKLLGPLGISSSLALAVRL